MYYFWWEWMHYAFQGWCFYITRKRSGREEKPPLEGAHQLFFWLLWLSFFFRVDLGLLKQRRREKGICRWGKNTPTDSARFYRRPSGLWVLFKPAHFTLPKHPFSKGSHEKDVSARQQSDSVSLGKDASTESSEIISPHSNPECR